MQLSVCHRGVGALCLVRGSLRLEAVELAAAVPGVGALVPGQQDTLTQRHDRQEHSMNRQGKSFWSDS